MRVKMSCSMVSWILLFIVGAFQKSRVFSRMLTLWSVFFESGDALEVVCVTSLG